MTKRFGVKLLINGIVVVPLLYLLTNATFWQILMSVILFEVLAFAIGDQTILRASNNTVATIADAGLAALFFWLAAMYYGWDLSGTELFVLAVGVGVAEWVFHWILGKWDRPRTAFPKRGLA